MVARHSSGNRGRVPLTCATPGTSRAREQWRESVIGKRMRLRCLRCRSRLLVPGRGVVSHEIPNDVTVQAFVKPEGQRLVLLVRVPMAAMREVDVPLRGPGYLDLARADDALRDRGLAGCCDNIDVCEGDAKLPRPRIADAAGVAGVRPVLRVVRAALAHMQRAAGCERRGPLLEASSCSTSCWSTPISSEQSKFSIHPRLARLGLQVVTVLRFLPPGGAERAFELHGDPGLVRLDPSWHQAGAAIRGDRLLHILDGTDHLLFIACLVIPFRRLRPLRDHRDRLHRGALDHADRVRVRPRRRRGCGFRRWSKR